MGKNKQVTCEICFKLMRSDKLKDHMKVHQKYSPTNKTPQSVEDICSDMVLEIADKVVSSTKESSGVKRKYEEVTSEAQATIDEEALEQSALKIQREFEEKTALGKALESNFSSVSTSTSCKPIYINEEAVFKAMDMYAEEYNRKLQLGEIVYKHAQNRGIPEESLQKEYKKVKDLYVKSMQNIASYNAVSTRKRKMRENKNKKSLL